MNGAQQDTPATVISPGSETPAARVVSKTQWFLGLTVIVALLLPPGAIGAEPSGQASPSKKTDTLWFIPHTHWEGAVFKTRAEYLDIGLPNILKALKLLSEHPDYRFVLDQVCYVKPFLERYPEQEATFRKFVAEGRLQLVGGTDVMPDVNMPSGESFVRQVLYGKGYYRDKLGVDVTVGWQLDTFGHHAQMPQLMKLAGYRSFWFFRGVSSFDVPSEFLWEGLDGTRIPAFWLPQGYAVTHGSPKTLPEFTRFCNQRFDLLGRWSRGADRVGLAGADVSEPEQHVPSLVEQFKLTFHYALVPHTGDWCQAKIYRQGLEFNRPLVVRKATAHAGPLARQWGFAEVSHSNCVISALKPGKDGTTVLRVYEATGKPAPGVKIKFHAKVTSAHEANLMEDPGHKLEASNNILSFDLDPFEIKTFLLQLVQ